MTPDTDAQLVARVLDGDRECYAILVERYQDSLFRYAVTMVKDGDLAADLVQDSLVKAYTSLSACQDPARFGAWVFRILVNRCKDHLKSRRSQTVPLDESTATTAAADDPALSADRAGIRRMMERALSTLPDAQREAFLLKHVEGLSYEEMAERLDVSVSALKMRVMRARDALQALLKGVAD